MGDNTEINELPVLTIIVPCYNEAEIIQNSFGILNEFLKKIIDQRNVNEKSFLCFIDDGSKDETYELLKKIVESSKNARVIKLTKNFGHQAALMAGLQYSEKNCDCAVTIDADLQDDFNAIEEMVTYFKSGFEIVYGVRNQRKNDTFFKRTTANIFYNLMIFLGAKTVKDHADYRLLSNRAINYLMQHQEVNLFLRGLIPEVGLKSVKVYYERGIRIAGETKYPLKKMIAFAIEGITSFSIKPLRVVTFLGLSIIALSVFIGIYILISFSYESLVQGWTSLIVSIWFLGGVQLFCLGIIGEYIGKIYKESKNRPKFLIENIIEP